MNTPATRQLLKESIEQLRAAFVPSTVTSGPAPLLPLDDDIRATPRVAIVGGPRTGKTTSALRHEPLGRTILSTDALVPWFEWSELSSFVVTRCKALSNFIVEGVRVAHALRKGLEVDLVVWMDVARVELTDKQRAMEKAVRTVFEEWASKASTRIVRVIS